MYMFKASRNLLPSNLQSHFKVLNNKYNTKQCGNFKLNFCRTVKKQMCISYMGVKCWNSIDKRIKDSKDISIFKKKFKQSLLDAND